MTRYAGFRRTARRQLGGFVGLERVVGMAAVVVAAAAPVIFSRFVVSFVITQALILGIAAAGLIFLSAYGGLVSLAQIALYGIAGFVLGNCVTHGETKGLNLGWNPWLGVIVGISVATAIALVFGAISSRSTGIYFLMITLTFAVITNLFFGQVTTLSGFGGISNIDSHTPGVIGSPDEHPFRLYYAALLVAAVVYAVVRYITRTPFGLSLQGVRDDPVRMSSLGYNVPLHRTLAFGFAGLLSAVGGVLFVWWNGHIDPATVDISATLDLLVIAVIGGLFRLEGAWLGAIVFVLINNYVRNIGVLHHVGIDEARFHTLIGVIFLLIVIASPGGLLGLWDSGKRLARRRAPGPEPAA